MFIEFDNRILEMGKKIYIDISTRCLLIVIGNSLIVVKKYKKL